MKEVWKDVQGFEGFYQVSNMGRLKSFKGIDSGYILSVKNSKGNYLNYVLSDNSKRKSCKIHRLVAELFLENPKSNNMIIHHKDGNKQNNRVDNLEWKSPQGHQKLHASQNPSQIAGMVRYNKLIKPKRIMQYSIDGKILGSYMNSKEAAKATGVCSRNILQVASHTEYKPGKVRKQAGGFIWRLEGR